jgi:hypothetical protein
VTRILCTTGVQVYVDHVDNVCVWCAFSPLAESESTHNNVNRRNMYTRSIRALCQTSCRLPFLFDKNIIPRLTAAVMGEITNIVMSNDEALVAMREEVAKVQTFINKRTFPRELSQDVVATYYEDLNASHNTERIVHLLSSSLRVDVAMHTSLPLLKRNELFTKCSSGFIASMAVVLRELTMAGDDILFRANDVCTDLYFVASNTVNLTVREASGQDTVRHVERHAIRRHVKYG